LIQFWLIRQAPLLPDIVAMAFNGFDGDVERVGNDANALMLGEKRHDALFRRRESPVLRLPEPG
jgi:hypothetical protein